MTMIPRNFQNDRCGLNAASKSNMLLEINRVPATLLSSRRVD
jgi:hypothetical protein